LVDDGKRYLADGKYNEAILSFRAAISANPQFVDAHYELALVYARLGQFFDASQELAKVLLIDANHGEAQIRPGNVHRLQG